MKSSSERETDGFHAAQGWGKKEAERKWSAALYWLMIILEAVAAMAAAVAGAASPFSLLSVNDVSVLPLPLK